MSELREILSETVTRLFTELCTKDLLEKADAGEWPEELWTAVVENGLSQPLLPEEKGGVGAGWEAAYVILHASGRYAAPIPLAETVLAGWLLDQAGMDVPNGILSIVPDVHGVSLSASGEVAGDALNVPWAARADYLVGLARQDGGLVIYLVPKGAFTTTADQNIARDPRDAVQFSGAAKLAAAPASFNAETLRLYGAMVRSAQMAGALERILEDTLEYTGDRTQFGKPIGKFQVIQQNLAMTAAEIAAAEAALAAAAEEEEEEEDVDLDDEDGEAPLPEGWAEYEADGGVFYFHAESNKAQWDRPT